MNRLKVFIQKKEFLRYFIMFFSGTLLAQIITVAISPVLTRLYTPAEFGVYGTYIAIVSLLIVFVTGRFEYAINTTDTDKDAVSVYRIVKYLTVFTSGAILVVIFFFAPFIKELFGFKFSYKILYFIPATLLLLGILQGSSFYLNRVKDFQTLSKSKIIQSLGNGATSVSAGLLNFGVIGIIVGNIAGVFLSYSYQKLKVGRLKKYSFDKERIKKNLGKYKQYPLYNAPSAFFDNLAIQAPVLILLTVFSETIVGFYSLTTRVIGMPLGLISTSISQVFLSQISELHRNGKSYKKVVLKVAKYLALLGFIPLSILGVFGPQLFSLVFGADWKVAGEYAQILSVGYFFKFVVSPLSIIFFINQRVKLLSIIQTTRALSTVILLLILSAHFKLETVLIAYTIHEAFFYMIYFYYILKTSK